MAEGTILVVDDMFENRRLLRLMLEQSGYVIHTAESAQAALQVFHHHPIDLALVDLQMAGVDGLTLLRQIRQIDPHAQVIVITAFGTVQLAVEAMKAGARDFLTRPVRREVLLSLVEQGVETGRLVAENRRLRDEVGAQHDFSQLVGRSPQMARVLALAAQAAEQDVTVLITGESGVGKEVLARAIHHNSARRTGRFLPVNCAAFTESLMESELFGHERGAFTGADRRHAGVFEQAGRGTLLLDEVADLPLPAQAKFLRALENREITPLGGTHSVRVEARILASTNADLRRRVHEKRFRSDLFYRLNVFAIHIPPLRERSADILPLANHALAKLQSKRSPEIPGFAQDAIEYMLRAPWYGNVRELFNAVERAVIVSGGDTVTAADFPPHLDSPGADIPVPEVSGGQFKLAEVERTLLLRALDRSGNNLAGAARILGMGRGALRYRLEKHGISIRGI